MRLKMIVLTTALYWISTGLLVPVVVFLLIMFLRGLLLLGSIYATFATRKKFNNAVQAMIHDILENHQDSSRTMPESPFFNPWFATAISKMMEQNWGLIHCQKIIADYESEADKRMTLTKLLLRLGPMLGLMGTLIPMGPALVSLGAGDISSMAANMQVAFSTTVVGIFIGGIGFLAQQLQNRWTIEELNHLDYISQLRTIQIDQKQGDKV